MRAIVDASTFAKALEKVGSNVKNAAIPYLEGIKMEFADGQCTLSFVNEQLTCWMSTVIPAEGDSFSCILCESKRFMRACKFFSGELAIEWAQTNEDQSKLHFRCGGKQGISPCENAALFPAPPAMEEPAVYAVTIPELLERVNTVQYAAGDIQSRPITNGVAFHGSRLFCVDGYRLAVSENENLKVEKPFVVPVSALKLLKQFGEKNGRMNVGKNTVEITDGKTTLCSRLILDEPLNLDAVVPKNAVETFTIDRTEMLDALKYCSTYMGKRTGVHMRFQGGEMTMLENAGMCQASIDIQGKSNIPFGFEIAYMKEGLEQFSGHERIEVQLWSSIAPAVLRADNSGFALVLPYRLREAKAA